MSQLTQSALLAALTAMQREFDRIDRAFAIEDRDEDQVEALGEYKLDLSVAYDNLMDIYEDRISNNQNLLKLSDYLKSLRTETLD